MCTVVRWLAGLAFAVIVLVVGYEASEEVRARLDRLPLAVLRLARLRLPAGLREQVHDQEWVPELEHVLHRAESFPLTRLITGVRFAAGLLIHAGAIAAELQPADAAHGSESETRTWRQRLTNGPKRMLFAVIWPILEPLPSAFTWQASLRRRQQSPWPWPWRPLSQYTHVTWSCSRSCSPAP